MKIKYFNVLIILSICLLLFQNCGKATIYEFQNESKKSEVEADLLISPALIEGLTPNSTKITTLVTEPGSAKIQSISLNDESLINEALTLINAQVTVDSESHTVTYTPPPGYQGYDQVEIWARYGKSKKKRILLTYIIDNNPTLTLPEVNVLAYNSDDQAALERKLSNTAIAPTMSQIFSTWTRFAKDKWYSSGQIFTGEANSWQLLNQPERVLCSINSGTYTGFVSTLKYEYYSHRATLTSTNGDDDGISVILAAIFENNTVYTISAFRTHGGISPRTGWGLVYTVNGSFSWVINEKDVGGVFTNIKNGDNSATGWNNRKTLVQAKRTGDLFEIKTSPWHVNESSLFISEDSLIQLDLDSDPRLHKFKGPQSYGYGSYSQAETTFLNVQFSTGLDDKFAYDIERNIVYEKQVGGRYLPRPDIDIYDHIGTPRVIFNPDTGKRFQLLPNKTFNRL